MPTAATSPEDDHAATWPGAREEAATTAGDGAEVEGRMSKQGSGFPQLKRVILCKIGEGSRQHARTHFLAHVPFCVPKIGF